MNERFGCMFRGVGELVWKEVSPSWLRRFRNREVEKRKSRRLEQGRSQQRHRFVVGVEDCMHSMAAI